MDFFTKHMDGKSIVDSNILCLALPLIRVKNGDWHFYTNTINADIYNNVLYFPILDCLYGLTIKSPTVFHKVKPKLDKRQRIGTPQHFINKPTKNSVTTEDLHPPKEKTFAEKRQKWTKSGRSEKDFKNCMSSGKYTNSTVSHMRTYFGEFIISLLLEFCNLNYS